MWWEATCDPSLRVGIQSRDTTDFYHLPTLRLAALSWKSLSASSTETLVQRTICLFVDVKTLTSFQMFIFITVIYLFKRQIRKTRVPYTLGTRWSDANQRHKYTSKSFLYSKYNVHVLLKCFRGINFVFWSSHIKTGVRIKYKSGEYGAKNTDSEVAFVFSLDLLYF